MKVNIKKISEITGFSPATVSNALNNKKGVNAKTAETVRKVAAELGYFVETHISKVKFVTFKKTGGVCENTPFFPLLLTGIEQECRNKGLDLILCTLDMRMSDYEEQLGDLLADKTSGIILLGTELVEETKDLLEKITNPMVVIDFWNGDMSFNSVQINNSDSARNATNYLIETGHTEIGYIRGDFRIVPFEQRGSGYRSAMRRANLPIKDEFMFTVGTNLDTAYISMKQHLEEGRKLPTAFIADNDIIAIGAMRALMEKNIKIPEDVSIIGFDDIPYAAVAVPPLTTVYVPKQDVGATAARRLVEIINGDTVKTRIMVSTTFVERDSVLHRR